MWPWANRYGQGSCRAAGLTQGSELQSQTGLLRFHFRCPDVAQPCSVLEAGFEVQTPLTAALGAGCPPGLELVRC